MTLLRDRRCLKGCEYCNKALDVKRGLKRFFGFDEFRKYDGVPLQEGAAQAATNYQSLLAIFPTGGGKSITFQVPALMQAENTKGLTVVISPLQSLMKDQVDNLEKVGIANAATINGLLDPIERSEAIERVSNGQVHLLYVSPESLRSPSIERLLLSRNISRFVIDEAHCLSSWGHDFRVDYLYIGEFIRNLQEKRKVDIAIPVSCFTATAKPQVVIDILAYFKQELGLDLIRFQSGLARKNLQYKVIYHQDDDTKYNTLRGLLEANSKPTIIYVSRTASAEKISDRLNSDGFIAKPFHGKLPSRTKSENQNAFIEGKVPIMVATTAFGMGVDKKDIHQVIHYDISESLENYVQEAGRAGRDENIVADCYVLYNEDDLNKHFILQNNTKVTKEEINQVWSALKEMTRIRRTVSNSALDIAREAGWNETVMEIETRVTTAISALEDAGYIKRRQNLSKVHANSIESKNAEEAIEKINQSAIITESLKQHAIRIIKYLIGSKQRSIAQDEQGEARIDHLSDLLSISQEQVIHIVSLLKQEYILADDKDLTTFIKHADNYSLPIRTLKIYNALLRYLSDLYDDEMLFLPLKPVKKELLEKFGIKSDIAQLRNALMYLAIKGLARFHYRDQDKNFADIHFLQSADILNNHLKVLEEVAPPVLQYIIDKGKSSTIEGAETYVEYSVVELQKALESGNTLLAKKFSIDEIEDSLFYLSKIGAFQIDGGFMVLHKRMRIERIEENFRVQFKNEDYRKLQQYYESKIQQVHIVGEYAVKMIDDYNSALTFVNDYFSLDYSIFLNKYFPGSRQDEIRKTVTPEKFKQLFGSLSLQQLNIINDKGEKVAILAGPGSGKTRVLVHKLAAVFMMEELKHEQILMLTFSRAAVTEFRKRLRDLIKNAVAFIEIKTFHAYCFDLLGQQGEIEKADNVIKEAVEAIHNQTIDRFRITKLILLVDEAQDINPDEYALIEALMKQNEGMRVIMVGDDDQNIFEFRGSDAKFLKEFVRIQKATEFELLKNYRSGWKLVAFTNRYIKSLPGRLKTNPIESENDSDGAVKLIRYKASHLTEPVVNEIHNLSLSGDTVVLVRTNREATQLYRALKQAGYRVQLIQDNKGIRLSKVMEVAEFARMFALSDSPIISPDQWNQSKREFKRCFHSSKWYSMVTRMIEDFEKSSPKHRYRSDLLSFVHESKVEDFLFEQQDTIYVSTYHKAKGKEFDNVHVVVAERDESPSAKRVLYVAMTRAKRNLIIHAIGSIMDSYIDEQVILVDNKELFGSPDELSVQLTHEHIMLSFFESKQAVIKQLISGQTLIPNEDGCKTSDNEFVIRYSNKYLEEEKRLKSEGYERRSASVNYLVYWDDENGKEVLIVLPEIVYARVN
jgi:ATP-dependent DNA helicase RecQ